MGLGDEKHLPRGVFLAISAASAGIAQLVEHLICNQRVASSNLAAGTIFPSYFNNLNCRLHRDELRLVFGAILGQQIALIAMQKRCAFDGFVA